MRGILGDLVICQHCVRLKMEAACRECDLKARVELRDAIALAIMAERKRCMKIALAFGEMYYNQQGPWDKECGEEYPYRWLLAKIRSGK